MDPFPGLGVDTVVLSVPVNGRVFDRFERVTVARRLPAGLGSRERYAHRWVPLANGRANVFAARDSSNGVSFRCTVTLGELLRGHNRDPVPLPLLEDVLDLAHQELSAVVGNLPSLELWRVLRMDIARNFLSADDPGQTLAAFARMRVPQPYARSVHDTAKGVQTLVIGPKKGWRVSAYDKHAELLAAAAGSAKRRADLLTAAAGHQRLLRVECQFYAATLGRRKLKQLGDFDTDTVHALAHEHFAKVGFGNIVSGSSRVAAVLCELDATGRQTEARLLSTLLMAQLLGTPDQMSPGTRAKADDVAREFGVNWADLEARGSVSRRLDFWSGLELVGTAAEVSA